MELEHWWQLRAGATDAALLAVDFGVVRAGCSFMDLVERLPGDDHAFQAVAPDPGPDLSAAFIPPWHVERWSAALHQVGAPGVRAIIAFCAGAPLASALRAAVGRAAALILIQPETVIGDTIVAQFEDAVRGLADCLSPTEVHEAVAGLASFQATLPAGGQTPAALAEAGLQRYAALARTCADRLGLGEHLAEELTARFASYLAYLVASSRTPLDDRDGTATVIATQTHPVWMKAARVERVAAAPHELLGDPDVARIVAEAIDRHDPATVSRG